MGLIETFYKANNFNYSTKTSKVFPDIVRGTFGGRIPPDEMLLTYEEVYLSYSTIYSCINEIATNIAGLPFKIKKQRKQRDGSIEYEDISDAPEFKALFRPNEFNTRYQFFYAATTHLCTSGELFIENVKSKNSNKILELWLHRPSKMDIIADEKGIKKFVRMVNNVPKDYSPDEITYLHFVHPFNDFRGFSPMTVLQMEIALGLNALKFGNNFFANGAKVSGVYTHPNEISDTAFDRVKEQFKDSYSGVNNAYSIMFLQGEGVYTPIGMTQAEMEYIQQMNMVDDRICGVYGVPKIFINKTESQSHANVQDQRKLLWQETLIPLCSMLLGMLDYSLLPKFTNDPDVYTELDYSGIEELQEDVDKVQTRTIEAWKWGLLLKNEARMILGLEPVEDETGDYSIIPMGTMLLEDLKFDLGIEPEKALMEHSIKALPEYVNNEEELLSPPKNEWLEKLLQHTKRTNIWRDGYRKRRVIEARFITESRKVFRKQYAEVLANIPKAVKSGFDYSKKITEGEFNINALLLNTEFFKKIFLKAFKKIRVVQLTDAVERISAIAGQELPKITVEHPAIAKILKQREGLIKGITETTNSLIHSQVKHGIEANESVEEITKRIKGVFQAASDSRARLIARTETNTVSCGMQLETMTEFGVEEKMWISQRDDRVREEHAALDGETVGINEAFSNGLQYPSEPGCRCDTLPVIK